MTSSGVANFNPTLSAIIAKAFRKMRVIRDDETPDADMRATALISLNEMVHDWQAMGIHVWTEEEGILFPQLAQTRYVTGTDHFTDANGYVATTTSAAAAAAATAVVGTSVTGMTAADFIGIELDDGTLQWTTIASLAGSTINLSAALTGSVSSGARIFTYTTKIMRPLKITRAARLNLDGDIETPLDRMWSRQMYMDQPNKTSRGMINAMFYAPKIPTGEAYLWQAPVDVDNLVRFTWHRPLYDFTGNSDTADLPQEWSAALTWGLALELSSEYPVPKKTLSVIAENAQAKTARLASWDREPESIYMQPDDEEG